MLKCVIKHLLSEWLNIKVNLLVKSCLRNEKKEYNIKGIYSDNKIKYKENDTLMNIDLKNITLERINENQEIKFNFKNNTCYIISDGLNLEINIEVLEKKVLNNYFYVYYKIENDYFKLEVKII